MAKIEKASEEMINLFGEIKSKTTIKNWLEFEVLCNNKQKELYKIVKTNDLVEVLTNGINFAVIFNEEIFDQLPPDLQEIAIVECLAGVSVNETDTVSLEKPNFNTHTGVLEKYGHAPIITLHESIKSLYDVKKQKEDEAKALTKGKRGRKPKQM
jgi:TRAP-type mannitol/chloroaromatic compound transport system substrate-binding protein